MTPERAKLNYLLKQEDQKLKELNNKLPAFDFLEINIERPDFIDFYGWWNGCRDIKISLCEINGIRYQKLTDYDWRFVSMINTKSDRSKLLMSRNRIRLIQVRYVEQLREKFIMLYPKDKLCFDYILSFASSATSLPQYTFSDAELQGFWDSHDERLELLQARKDRKRALAAGISLEEYLGSDSKQVPVVTLKELVQQIEDMGWKVTLELKTP